MKYLQSLFEKILGKDNVILFTVNPSIDSVLKCGTISTLFTTVDFGVAGNVTSSFHLLRKYQPHGPLVNTEFYTGWLDNWGLPHHTQDPKIVASVLDEMLKMKASVNMYMFEGGSNFGFTNGANIRWHPEKLYQPQPTSYDYGAPLSEAGDITEMFHVLREVIGKYLPLPPGPIPPSSPKHAYGKVHLTKTTSLADLFSDFKRFTWTHSKYPLTMEQLEFYFGFTLYKTAITYQGSATLVVTGVRDRAVVYCDKIRQGVVSRNKPTQIRMNTIGCFNLFIMVENQGRVNSGVEINDPKGIIRNVTLNGNILENWDMASVDPNTRRSSLFSAAVKNNVRPDYSRMSSDPAGIFHGIIPPIPSGQAPQDSYLLLKGWHKGQVYVNDFNLGRYWPVEGPQVTLYVPKTVFQNAGSNSITVFELDQAPCEDQSTCFVEFTVTPILNGTVTTVYN